MADLNAEGFLPPLGLPSAACDRLPMPNGRTGERGDARAARRFDRLYGGA